MLVDHQRDYLGYLENGVKQKPLCSSLVVAYLLVYFVGGRHLGFRLDFFFFHFLQLQVWLSVFSSMAKCPSFYRTPVNSSSEDTRANTDFSSFSCDSAHVRHRLYVHQKNEFKMEGGPVCTRQISKTPKNSIEKTLMTLGLAMIF